ncbi:MAG: cell division protein FtsK [Bdellovibrionales bacterium RBG_16_40_8]|nr:MAG: cell division protein FtsK [Bdellovibrionales bacterium RBG_16_40_8]
MNRLFKRFSRDIIGLVWLSIGIFLAFALLSFRPTDPSFNSIGKAYHVYNFCGYFGSYLADIFYQLLGVSSWVLVLSNLRLAWRNFKGQEPKKKRSQWLWLTLLLFTCASLLALYFPEKQIFMGQIRLGGLLGHIISKALISAFNQIGVSIILWTAALILLVFYTEMSVEELFSRPRLLIARVWSTICRLRIFGSILSFSAVVFKKIQNLLEAPKLLAANTETMAMPIKKFLPIKKDIAAEEKEEQIQVMVQSEPIERRPISLNKSIQRKIENWELPKISLLEDPPYNRNRVDDREIREKAQRLLNKLRHFNISGEVVAAKPGPAVTMFEYKPNADVKISRITDLADDLSLELSSESVRIIAPIPGRDVVGIETSNSSRETVYLKEILADEEFWDEKIALPLALGCEADGTRKIVDLRKMPHMLVAGTTGSGKSVFIVSLLTGLLFRHSPKTLRLILIDPKQVDLATFSKVPHLLMPPIRESKKAINALRWAIKEMEKRYRSMAKFGARDLESFNQAVSRLASDEFNKHEITNAEAEATYNGQTYYYTTQPYTLIVVEEFGDLMSVDKNNVEQCVVRLAQMARACGIHLILAMQSPRKDVITGLIKTNIPGRVSFKVASKMDSRIILDESGAERLLTRGDMLYLAPGVSKPQRHHGPWVTDQEIQAACQFWVDQAEPEYDPQAMKALEGPNTEIDGFVDDSAGEVDDAEIDDRYDEILAYISTLKEVSASHIQMRFRLGYPRAARLIEIFEQQGAVGPASGSKKRQVLINELK